MKQFLIRRWFLLSLAAILVLGMGRAETLATLPKNFPRLGVVATVLFIMSVTLDARSMWKALAKPKAVILAVCINLGLLPLLAWAVSFLLSEDSTTGLLVAASIPSTLASAAVWTRRAGGNDAVATLVMMVTNLSCFIITPAWLFATTGSQIQELNIEPKEMAAKLAMVVVLPIILGQIARLIPGVGSRATEHKIPLGILAQFGILSMVLLGAIKSGVELHRDGIKDALSIFDWFSMLGSVIGVHVTMLWTGHKLGKLIVLTRADRIAVGFSGSQKTLMVGLEVAITYFPFAPILPVVSYHVCQLLFDTIVADRLRKG